MTNTFGSLLSHSTLALGCALVLGTGCALEDEALEDFAESEGEYDELDERTYNPISWTRHAACVGGMVTGGVGYAKAAAFCHCVEIQGRAEDYCECRHVGGGDRQSCNAEAGTTYNTDTKSFVDFRGKFYAISSDLCVHKVRGDWQLGTKLHLWDCDAGASAQKSWFYDESTGLIHAKGNPDICWHKERGDWMSGQRVHLWDCDAGGPDQKTWYLDSNSGQIRAQGNTNMCVGVWNGLQGSQLVLRNCDEFSWQRDRWELDRDPLVFDPVFN